jgi:hypothetical protein
VTIRYAPSVPWAAVHSPSLVANHACDTVSLVSVISLSLQPSNAPASSLFGPPVAMVAHRYFRPVPALRAHFFVQERRSSSTHGSWTVAFITRRSCARVADAFIATHRAMRAAGCSQPAPAVRFPLLPTATHAPTPTSVDKLRTYHEALASDAAEVPACHGPEYGSLVGSDVFTEVELPGVLFDRLIVVPVSSTAPTDRSIATKPARIVAQGFTQRPD